MLLIFPGVAGDLAGLTCLAAVMLAQRGPDGEAMAASAEDASPRD